MKNTETKTTINKLFLIGNGFDLALGLKTSYNDFIFWLLQKYLMASLENYGSQLAPKEYSRFSQMSRGLERNTIYGFSRNPLFDVLIKKSYDKNALLNTFKNFNSVQELLEFIQQKHIEIEVKPKINNGLFSAIYKQVNLGWVDIEGIYFNLVKDLVNAERTNTGIDIEHYNEDLKHIIVELEAYLRSLELDIPATIAKDFFSQFLAPIQPDEVFLEDDKTLSENAGHLYFLNFNYTFSLQYILNGCGLETENYSINHIHGCFDEDSPIIFGFGDEMDESYQKMETINDNRFFEYIKSFKYFSNPNYRNLLRFLNSAPYQVCIYGHSCGLSDRIMLNEIFEHRHCKSIKIYFYEDAQGHNDFITKTMDISRHFNSNQLMREKIVAFDAANKIPQVKKE